MHKARPGTNSISPEGELWPHLANEFRENEMNRNGISVETIGSWRENEVAPDRAKRAVPPPPDVIRREPPHKTSDVRSGNFWNAMPSQLREIQILGALTVDVNVIIFGQTRSPFGDMALCAVTLVDERRNDRENLLGGRLRHLWRNLHRFAPALQHQERLGARPLKKEIARRIFDGEQLLMTLNPLLSGLRCGGAAVIVRADATCAGVRFRATMPPIRRAL